MIWLGPGKGSTSHPGGLEEEEDAEVAALARKPAIVGLTYRFADAATEARFQAAIAPASRRRLVTLCWVALAVCLVRLGAPLLGLVADPWFAPNLMPRCAQLLLCAATLCLLWRIRFYRMVEVVACAFGVAYIATCCWLLSRMAMDGSGGMLVGTITLLVFGLPVRLIALSPALAVSSCLMLSIWSGRTQASDISILQVSEWLAVVTLLGTFVLRMLRLTLRQQFALREALRHLATHDALTSIANRRRYDQFLAAQWEQCREQARPLSLVLLDVDFFKLLNDKIGHEAGDDCLRDLAALLVHCVDDPASLVARTGGEEFACVLPGATPEAALKVAECITAALNAEEMPHPQSPIGPNITVSLGVATGYPAQGGALRDLTGLADRLVYEAKAEGRACLRQQVLGRRGERVARVEGLLF